MPCMSHLLTLISLLYTLVVAQKITICAFVHHGILRIIILPLYKTCKILTK